ncbi:MAG TPA: baseplate J/gp47 family protein, partial [Bacteroidales bacterium]|nr:baseplate J/gp47 family protein [Bacteroidales bacterium]
EENRTFYTRISERLRHKNRSWNIWDFERIILEKFPSILKVKCIPHANPEFDYSPGNVYIIVIPDILKINQKNILQPRLSKSIIEEVKQFISKYTSPFVNIYINNPTYEEICVICDVKLAVGYDDKSYYENQLNEDIKSFIAPWINNKEVIPSFGGTIYKSQIINYIEERPYIDYITTCEIKKNNTLCSYDAIRGSYEYMIITSSPIHNISTEGLC